MILILIAPVDPVLFGPKAPQTIPPLKLVHEQGGDIESVKNAIATMHQRRMTLNKLQKKFGRPQHTFDIKVMSYNISILRNIYIYIYILTNIIVNQYAGVHMTFPHKDLRRFPSMYIYIYIYVCMYICMYIYIYIYI